MARYGFSLRIDGSWRCESRIAGEGACLVRRNPAGRGWQVACPPPPMTDPSWLASPASTRQGAVMAHFA